MIHIHPTLSLKKLCLFMTLLLCVLLVESAANNPWPQQNRQGGGVMHEDAMYGNDHFDVDLDHSLQEDHVKLTSHEFLEKHGLGQIAHHFSQFISIFDTSTHLFSKLDDDEQFGVLNRVIEAFRDAYIKTVGDVSASPNRPGTYNISAMKDFFSRHEMNFNRLLQQDQNILDSEWAQFLGQTHYVFDSLKELYQLALANGLPGLPLNSFMLDLSATMMRAVPDDLFNRNTFSEVLQMPGQLQSTLHDILESALTSDYGPMIKMAAQVAANYAMQRRDEL
jgi:hypothetical protein